jgi:hypothetical protein
MPISESFGEPMARERLESRKTIVKIAIESPIYASLKVFFPYCLRSIFNGTIPIGILTAIGISQALICSREWIRSMVVTRISSYRQRHMSSQGLVPATRHQFCSCFDCPKSNFDFGHKIFGPSDLAD